MVSELEVQKTAQQVVNKAFEAMLALVSVASTSGAMATSMKGRAE
jgi:hypothetical protein